MRNLDLRLAKFIPPKGRGILVFADGQMSEAMSLIIERFRQSNPRENVFILDPKVPGRLPEDGGKVEYPLLFPKYARRFFRRLRLQMVLVDEGARPTTRFVRYALTYGSAIGFLNAEEQLPRRLGKVAEISASKENNRVYTGLAEKNTEQVIACIALEVVREPEEYSTLKKRFRFFLWKHIKARLLSSSLKQRISFEQVQETLGHPSSILCLGNGPSCEDSDLLEIKYQSLFRVNHRWLERGQFTSPDVVFTGALDSVLKTGRDILYVFITGERASRIIMKASSQLEELSYCNAYDLGFPLDSFLPYQPTNGVIMLYFAVMLQPDQLTIAGIDLYRDPRGCYPDDNDMPNDYTSAHNDQKELEIILSILGEFKGQLTIIGDSLKNEYTRNLRENEFKISQG